MPKRDGGVSQKILEKLTLLEPPIKRFPVIPADPAMGIFLVKLADVQAKSSSRWAIPRLAR